MATKKAGGTAKNLRDSKPKYLGVKLFAGERADTGDVIVRQRGTKVLPGRNVGVGKDHTLFARTAGTVVFRTVRKRRFDGTVVHRSKVEVETAK